MTRIEVHHLLRRVGIVLHTHGKQSYKRLREGTLLPPNLDTNAYISRRRANRTTVTPARAWRVDGMTSTQSS